jgi:hypothetical protein
MEAAPTKPAEKLSLDRHSINHYETRKEVHLCEGRLEIDCGMFCFV